MKQNNHSVIIGGVAFGAMFIILFIVGFTMLHQIVNFLITYQGAGLYPNR